MGLTHSAAKVIEVYGTDEQKTKYMAPLYEGRYAGTMNLTEDQAGSDVGSIRTKATRNPDGSRALQSRYATTFDAGSRAPVRPARRCAHGSDLSVVQFAHED